MDKEKEEGEKGGGGGRRRGRDQSPPPDPPVDQRAAGQRDIFPYVRVDIRGQGRRGVIQDVQGHPGQGQGHQGIIQDVQAGQGLGPQRIAAAHRIEQSDEEEQNRNRTQQQRQRVRAVEGGRTDSIRQEQQPQQQQQGCPKKQEDPAKLEKKRKYPRVEFVIDENFQSQNQLVRVNIGDKAILESRNNQPSPNVPLFEFNVPSSVKHTKQSIGKFTLTSDQGGKSTFGGTGNNVAFRFTGPTATTNVYRPNNVSDPLRNFPGGDILGLHMQPTLVQQAYQQQQADNCRQQEQQQLPQHGQAQHRQIQEPQPHHSRHPPPEAQAQDNDDQERIADSILKDFFRRNPTFVPPSNKSADENKPVYRPIKLSNNTKKTQVVEKKNMKMDSNYKGYSPLFDRLTLKRWKESGRTSFQDFGKKKHYKKIFTKVGLPYPDINVTLYHWLVGGTGFTSNYLANCLNISVLKKRNEETVDDGSNQHIGYIQYEPLEAVQDEFINQVLHWGDMMDLNESINPECDGKKTGQQDFPTEKSWLMYVLSLTEAENNHVDGRSDCMTRAFVNTRTNTYSLQLPSPVLYFNYPVKGHVNLIRGTITQKIPDGPWSITFEDFETGSTYVAYKRNAFYGLTHLGYFLLYLWEKKPDDLQDENAMLQWFKEQKDIGERVEILECGCDTGYYQPNVCEVLYATCQYASFFQLVTQAFSTHNVTNSWGIEPYHFQFFMKFAMLRILRGHDIPDYPLYTLASNSTSEFNDYYRRINYWIPEEVISWLNSRFQDWGYPDVQQAEVPQRWENLWEQVFKSLLDQADREEQDEKRLIRLRRFFQPVWAEPNGVGVNKFNEKLRLGLQFSPTYSDTPSLFRTDDIENVETFLRTLVFLTMKSWERMLELHSATPGSYLCAVGPSPDEQFGYGKVSVAATLYWNGQDFDSSRGEASLTPAEKEQLDAYEPWIDTQFQIFPVINLVRKTFVIGIVWRELALPEHLTKEELWEKSRLTKEESLLGDDHDKPPRIVYGTMSHKRLALLVPYQEEESVKSIASAIYSKACPNDLTPETLEDKMQNGKIHIIGPPLGKMDKMFHQLEMEFKQDPDSVNDVDKLKVEAFGAAQNAVVTALFIQCRGVLSEKGLTVALTDVPELENPKVYVGISFKVEQLVGLGEKTEENSDFFILQETGCSSFVEVLLREELDFMKNQQDNENQPQPEAEAGPEAHVFQRENSDSL